MSTSRGVEFSPRDVALVQSAYTRLAFPHGARRMLELQNRHATAAAQLYFSDKLWCLSFDGTGDYVTADGLAADVTFAAATSGAMRARIRLDAVGTTARTIMSASLTGANTYLVLGVTTAGTVTASLCVGGTVKWTVTATAALSANTWYTVELKHNGTEPTLYVDGEKWVQTFSVTVLKTAWVAALVLAGATKAVRIGSVNTNGVGEANLFVGDMDWADVHTGTGVGRTQEAQWLLQEGTGATATDETGNGYDGTITGATWAPNVGPVDLYSGETIIYDVVVPVCGVWAYTATASHSLTVAEGV